MYTNGDVRSRSVDSLDDGALDMPIFTHRSSKGCHLSFCPSVSFFSLQGHIHRPQNQHGDLVGGYLGQVRRSMSKGKKQLTEYFTVMSQYANEQISTAVKEATKE